MRPLRFEFEAPYSKVSILYIVSIKTLNINLLNKDISIVYKFSIDFLKHFFGVPHLATFIFQFSLM
jgi:hypothetical protein